MKQTHTIYRGVEIFIAKPRTEYFAVINGKTYSSLFLPNLKKQIRKITTK
jgi:hypothetical protein